MKTKLIGIDYSSEGGKVSRFELDPRSNNGALFIDSPARKQLLEVFATQLYWLHRLNLTEEEIDKRLAQSDNTEEPVVQGAKLDLAKAYAAHFKYCAEQAVKASRDFGIAVNAYLCQIEDGVTPQNE